MRIVFDLDGTICDLREPEQSYIDVQPKDGAREVLQELKSQGHYIIIYTARHMKTCNNNVNLVRAKIGQLTIDWLNNHGILYDELIFGKPFGDIYIDDLAFRFNSWEDIKNNLKTYSLVKE
ncbi:HAD hydrolase family protein [Bacillus gobiensis]|uniref:HAD hydrolase family protein n=1 Tax=Bacillus gobiensis TaxID=1441095 RepID=UPI003D23EE9A